MAITFDLSVWRFLFAAGILRAIPPLRFGGPLSLGVMRLNLNRLAIARNGPLHPCHSGSHRNGGRYLDHLAGTTSFKP